MALRIALDTNRYTDYVTGIAAGQDAVVRAAEVYLPFVVLAELRGGYRLGKRCQENERVLAEFLRTPRVQVLFADEHTTHVYAELYADLRRAGTPIPTSDLWIAALAIQHDLALFSRDRHFDAVPRLPRN